MMAMARRVMAQRYTKTTTRAMGDNDYDDDYGNGAAGDEVDDDGDDTNYGNRQRR